MKPRGFQIGTFGLDALGLLINVRSAVDQGASLIRYQMMHPDAPGWTAQQYQAWWRDQLDLIRDMIYEMRDRGIFAHIVVDCHTGPGPAESSHSCITNTYWRAIWRENWLAAVEHLKDLDEIWGYDLLNEPLCRNQRKWLQFAGDLAKQIRQQDRRTRIIIESRKGAPGAFRAMRPINVPKVWYSAHIYKPRKLCFYGIFDNITADQARRAARNLTIEKAETILEPVRTFQRRYKVPIYIGEIGCSIRTHPDDRDHFFRQFLSLFNRYRWAWSVHAWRESWEFDYESYGGLIPIMDKIK
ncbi:MAG: cellulase family glycosylhydrolase [Candidatus Latescibacteria bacterium]|nr:cellulase family glycosylhydrolase [Candidatus Latescibacterota bacterium]NIO78092.1 cellulase family glycosylhydrolase [Candidatus Latescibacterota bacterium]